MLNELAIRFVVGGAVVSIFAAIAEMFEQKTLAGLFGAAPSVALATLMLAYFQHGPSYIAIEGRSMIIGAVGLFAYSSACVLGCKSRRRSIWLVAVAAWGVWLVVVMALCQLGRASGVLS